MASFRVLAISQAGRWAVVSRTDVLVLGAGPAGLAAAIVCREVGLVTRILDGAPARRVHPPESLHPECMSILQRLGCADFSGAVRGSFANIICDGRRQAVGASGERGLHVDRARLDAMLEECARRQLGLAVERPVQLLSVLREGDCVRGVATSIGDIEAGWLIDAAGSSQWLARQLRVERQRLSPPLFAFRGTARPARLPNEPELIAEPRGWTFLAPLCDGSIVWTRVATKAEAPASVSGIGPLTEFSCHSGSEVTWRIVSPTAVGQCLMVGEAAAVLDPASGQGVLRALRSGIAAAQTIAEASQLGGMPVLQLLNYDDWMARSAMTQAVELARRYRSLGIGIFDDVHFAALDGASWSG